MSKEKEQTESGVAGNKRKCWPAWRVVLTDFVIVVLGVGVAMATQQGVEWLHWQGEVKAARKAIFAEMAANSNFFASRLAFTPCMERQANEAERILDDLEAGRPPGRLAIFHPGYGSSLLDSDWQSERSAGSLTHFPRDQLALIGRFYATYGRFDSWSEDERAAWRTLAVLRHPPGQMAAGDVLRLRESLATARDTQGLIILNAERQLRRARRLGVAVKPTASAAVQKFCTLDHEAFRKYLAQIEPYG